MYLPDVQIVSNEDPNGNVPKKNTSGMNNLRFHYSEGIDVKKDEYKAFHKRRK
ncbi:16913_t:CDS:1 [Dentiscutata heterogama]|uniref:16913_t:CDS:1 n=1 Tax=Dentiscutata heterogama TaxID=1316150 RepID=A0ACA9KY10_9GLOM|nr:16913_t:CDS:1 [Dentiscutata heterogama]